MDDQTYIGDGVYGAFTGDAIFLTTDGDNMESADGIYLGTTELQALILFAKKHQLLD